MGSNKNISSNRPGGLTSRLHRLGEIITSGPVLIGLTILILGGCFALVLHTRESFPQAASAKPLAGAAASPSPTISPSPQPTRAPASLTPTSTPLPPASPSPDPGTKTPIEPTPTLPVTAQVSGLRGHPQSKPLSCEARSAVDWAAYFGLDIDEDDFFAGLPSSDNPEQGFVGDVNGSWGQIPPEDYGVHAGPIAQRLREYGLKAKSLRHMTLDELQREIALGKPVIVWVVGHVNRGTPVPYTAASGEMTTVAKFEHTVIVIGYTETRITVQDGARTYSIYKGEFQKSWDVLENQAVVWIE